MDLAVDLAVEDCIEGRVMADILIPFRAEVKKVLLTGYTEERVRELFERDAREEGIRQGIEQGKQQERTEIIAAFLSNGGTEEEATRLLGVTAEEIALAREHCATIARGK